MYRALWCIYTVPRNKGKTPKLLPQNSFNGTVGSKVCPTPAYDQIIRINRATPLLWPEAIAVCPRPVAHALRWIHRVKAFTPLVQLKRPLKLTNLSERGKKEKKSRCPEEDDTVWTIGQWPYMNKVRLIVSRNSNRPNGHVNLRYH